MASKPKCPAKSALLQPHAEHVVVDAVAPAPSLPLLDRPNPSVDLLSVVGCNPATAGVPSSAPSLKFNGFETPVPPLLASSALSACKLPLRPVADSATATALLSASVSLPPNLSLPPILDSPLPSLPFMVGAVGAPPSPAPSMTQSPSQMSDSSASAVSVDASVGASANNANNSFGLRVSLPNATIPTYTAAAAITAATAAATIIANTTSATNLVGVVAPPSPSSLGSPVVPVSSPGSALSVNDFVSSDFGNTPTPFRCGMDTTSADQVANPLLVTLPGFSSPSAAAAAAAVTSPNSPAANLGLIPVLDFNCAIQDLDNTAMDLNMFDSMVNSNAYNDRASVCSADNPSRHRLSSSTVNTPKAPNTPNASCNNDSDSADSPDAAMLAAIDFNAIMPGFDPEMLAQDLQRLTQLTNYATGHLGPSTTNDASTLSDLSLTGFCHNSHTGPCQSACFAVGAIAPGSPASTVRGLDKAIPPSRRLSFVCEPCKFKRFKSQKDLLRHFKAYKHRVQAAAVAAANHEPLVTLPTDNEYECGCGFRQPRKDLYKRHLRSCKGTRLGLYRCVCDHATLDHAVHNSHLSTCGLRRRGRRPVKYVC